MGHVERGKIYAEYLKAKLCVFNFVGVSEFPTPLTAWNKSDEEQLPSGSFFAYVFHKHDFTKARILYWSNPKEQHDTPVTFV